MSFRLDKRHLDPSLDHFIEEPPERYWFTTSAGSNFVMIYIHYSCIHCSLHISIICLM